MLSTSELDWGRGGREEGLGGVEGGRTGQGGDVGREGDMGREEGGNGNTVN